MASVRERGQLLLVGGLAIAVSLVVIALVLNSAIYTENLATRNSDSTDETGLELTKEIRTDSGDVLVTVNHQSPFNYGSLNTRFGQAFGDVATVQRRSSALGGRSVDVSAGPREFGTRIRDDGGTPEFVPATTGYDALGDSDYDDEWAVVQDAKIRQFEMSVDNPPSLTPSATDPLSGTMFFIEIRDSSSTQKWQIVPYGDGSGNFGVFVYEADADTLVGSCLRDTSTPVEFDITAGTVEGKPCPALSFVETLGSTQDVYFEKAQQGEGEYELVVDRVMETSAAGATGFPFESVVDRTNYGSHCDGPTYEETTGGEPFAVPALYATDVDTSYRTSGVTYENSVRVAPGESGDRTRHPRIKRFDVEDPSEASGATFDLSWEVVDPDGTSPSVTVELVPSSGSTVSATGLSASGSTSLSTSNPGPYTLRIVASDGSLTRTVTERHANDDDGTGGGDCPE